MAIELPKARIAPAPQPKKRQVPVEAIIQALGNNPIANAIQDVGPMLSKALERRAQLRKDASQIEAIGKATGTDLRGITDPSIAAGIGKSAADNRSEELRANEAAAARATQIREANEIKRMLAEQQIQSREDNRRQRDEQFKDRQVNLYSSRLDSAGIPQAIAAGQRVLTMLPERGKDVPGYGGFESNVPNFAVGQSGRDFRGAVAQLFNTELKDRSGATVVDNELQRLKTEFQQGRFDTEEGLRQGLSQYLQRLNEISTNQVAGFDQGIRDEYTARGGRDVLGTFNQMIQAPQLAPPTGGWSNEKEMRYRALKAKQQAGGL